MDWLEGNGIELFFATSKLYLSSSNRQHNKGQLLGRFRLDIILIRTMWHQNRYSASCEILLLGTFQGLARENHSWPSQVLVTVLFQVGGWPRWSPQRSFQSTFLYLPMSPLQLRGCYWRSVYGNRNKLVSSWLSECQSEHGSSCMDSVMV